MPTTVGNKLVDEVVIIDPRSGTHQNLRMVAAQSPEHFYSSAEGGRVAYNSSPGIVALGTAGGLVFSFDNPAASGVDCYMARFILTTDIAGRFDRFRSGTLSIIGTAATAVNRGGGSNAPQAKSYAAGAATATGGILSKVQYAAQDSDVVSRIDGSIILRPGQNTYWRFTPKGNTASNPSVEVVWWEQSAAA